MEKTELLRKLRKAEAAGNSDAANQILATLARLKRKEIARTKRFISRLTEEH